MKDKLNTVALNTADTEKTKDKSRSIHMRLDIRGALLNWENRMFENMFKTNDGRTMTGREAKLQLMDELAKGHNYIPYGDCPGFDPVEKGCPGHEQ